MSTNSLILEASDTLFFRDGRPFTMGEDNYVDGVNSFPPIPSVLFGALCTTFFTHKPNVWEHLTVNNIWLKHGSTAYFPLPKDLVVVKKQNNSLEAKKLLKNENKLYSNFSQAQFLVRDSNDKEKLEEGSFFIGQLDLNKYLLGTSNIFKTINISDLIHKETKLGIGRNLDSHITEEGHLYRITMQRPELSIGIKFNGLELENSHQIPMQLGGEKKIAWAKENTIIPEMSCPILDKKQFKIYLTTPALFLDGWYPKTLLESNKLTLLTAAIDKPINIGGWDIANNIPKPMLQAVPAGSVYYLEAESIEAANHFAKTIHGNSISDYVYESSNKKQKFKSNKQGFGIALIGKV